MTTKLSVVQNDPPPAPKPYDEKRGAARIAGLRKQLLNAAVQYVQSGTAGTRGDRLRQASHMSGIPLVLIETNLDKGAR